MLLAFSAGSEPDWVLDLVATGFNKPEHLFGASMRDNEDVDAAADAFREKYVRVSQSLPACMPAQAPTSTVQSLRCWGDRRSFATHYCPHSPTEVLTHTLTHTLWIPPVLLQDAQDTSVAPSVTGDSQGSPCSRSIIARINTVLSSNKQPGSADLEDVRSSVSKTVKGKAV
jgi:hypothetical protein